MAGAEGPAGRQSELEPVVSLVDVLEEDEELEKEACAVLGGSDSEKCSYSQVGARPRPRLPQAPAGPTDPDPPCPVPARPTPAWWSAIVIYFRLPHPRPSCPFTLGLRPAGPLFPPSSPAQPLRIPRAWAAARSFFFRLFSALRLLFRNPSRDLLNPDIFVPTFPILRAFVKNRMEESKQS